MTNILLIGGPRDGKIVRAEGRLTIDNQRLNWIQRLQSAALRYHRRNASVYAVHMTPDGRNLTAPYKEPAK